MLQAPCVHLTMMLRAGPSVLCMCRLLHHMRVTVLDVAAPAVENRFSTGECLHYA